MATEPADGSRRLRIGLFGGTFDPPHRAHVAVAHDVADALDLDRVLWIPAGDPPHKSHPDLTPAPLRLEMVRRAIEGEPRFTVSALELRRVGPSYTVDTLRELREAHPNAELFFILGADEYAVLDTWRDPESVLALCTLAVLDRDGQVAARRPPDVPGAEAARFVPVGRLDLSSTEIRERARAGEDIRHDVPAGVAELIEREGLYRG